jgi:integrase
MDKFETEHMEHIKSIVDELQQCFIEDDTYSRTPSASEWRHATRTVRQLALACHELFGYVKAKRTIEMRFTRQGLKIEINEKEADYLELEEGKGVVIFSEKEILTMPKEKRKYFRIDGRKVPYRKRENGVYELRKRIDGVDYYGSSTDLKTAKARFIEDLQEHENAHIRKKAAVATVAENLQSKTDDVPCVEDYAFNYLDVYKKNYICEKSYKHYEGIIRRHIAKNLSAERITQITGTKCQSILNELHSAGKKRTAEDVKNLLSWICAAAVSDGLLAKNPMDTVNLPKHKRETGKCIPLELMKRLLVEPQSKYDYVIWLIAYTGIRPCEVKSATFSGDFMTVQNAKADIHDDPTFRTIPIHTNLFPYLPKIKECIRMNISETAKHFRRKSFTKGYRFYDLRHTFTTFAQECGANKEWVDYVTNHVGVQNVTSRVYTHWTDDFHRKQMGLLHF